MLNDKHRRKSLEKTASNGSTNTQTTKGEVKRYNLGLPEDLFNQIQGLADKKHTSVLEILKRFIKLGLLAAKLEDNPDTTLIIREGNTEREIIFL